MLGLLLAGAAVKVTGAVGGDPRVSALVANAGGSLRPGSDVKLSGVIVGKVADIGRGTDGDVRVEMRMPDDDLALVPANVQARILPATVFGTSFVDLVVYDGPSPESLEPGAVVPADTTQGTLELQQALDDIDRLVTALGPAELASAIGSTALALEGRGEKIGRLVDTADRYVARLRPELPQVRSDLRRLADTLEVVDRVAPDLLQATEDGLVTLDTIVAEQASIMALITGGTSLARTSRGFLDSNQRAIVRMLDNGALLLDALYDNRKIGITDSVAVNIRLGQVVPSAVREGFLRTDAHIELDAPPYYTPADRPRYGDAGPRTGAGAGRSDRGAPGLRQLLDPGGAR